LEKLLSGGTSKTFKTETFLPAMRWTAIAGPFSPGFDWEMGISGCLPVRNRPELNPPFTNAAGEVRPTEGARFQNRYLPPG